MAFLQPRREAGKRGVIPDLVVEVVDSTTRTRDLGPTIERSLPFFTKALAETTTPASAATG